MCYVLAQKNYRKTSKNSEIAIINLKVEQGGFILRVMRPNDAEGIAKSVDPDLGLHCLPRPICPKT